MDHFGGDIAALTVTDGCGEIKFPRYFLKRRLSLPHSNTRQENSYSIAQSIGNRTNSCIHIGCSHGGLPTDCIHFKAEPELCVCTCMTVTALN